MNVTPSGTPLPSGIVFDTGNQDINGIKTFGLFPVSPSGYPTTDFEMANKKYVDTNAGLVAWERNYLRS